MGDRANVKVVDFDSTVFLYTHWSGSELPTVLQAALKRGRERWDDGQYLTRIIFCEMIGKDSGLTGYGISSVVGDGDDHIITVNIQKQTVSIGDEKFDFEDYVTMKKPSWY